MKRKRDWLSLMDGLIDRSEPVWLLVVLLLTGIIYVLVLLRLFLCG